VKNSKEQNKYRNEKSENWQTIDLGIEVIIVMFEHIQIKYLPNCFFDF
jgi:hypothetical protein